MNKEQMMEAMARLDGWDLHPKEVEDWTDPAIWAKKEGRGLVFKMNLPDYFTDNEIDRMVRGLDGRELDTYATTLSRIISPDLEPYWTPDGVTEILKATEDQKVEAYLKAKGEED
jgi:hypothetical protein